MSVSMPHFDILGSNILLHIFVELDFNELVNTTYIVGYDARVIIIHQNAHVSTFLLSILIHILQYVNIF